MAQNIIPKLLCEPLKMTIDSVGQKHDNIQKGIHVFVLPCLGPSWTQSWWWELSKDLPMHVAGG